jgi:hypothetical protein
MIRPKIVGWALPQNISNVDHMDFYRQCPPYRKPLLAEFSQLTIYIKGENREYN